MGIYFSTLHVESRNLSISTFYHNHNFSLSISDHSHYIQSYRPIGSNLHSLILLCEFMTNLNIKNINLKNYCLSHTNLYGHKEKELPWIIRLTTRSTRVTPNNNVDRLFCNTNMNSTDVNSGIEFILILFLKSFNLIFRSPIRYSEVFTSKCWNLEGINYTL